MTKSSKIFLILSIGLFALSLTGPGSDIGWGLAKPMGAVCFILFLISQLLAKETARHDEEMAASQQGRTQAARSKSSGNGALESSGRVSGRPVASH